ncbi:MAG: hydrogenase iron-sulfur subunit [Pseudomonadota bacterium]
MKRKIKVLAFLCNWAPWSCYTGMGNHGTPIPEEINVIRVMCAGRVNTALLLKAFEKGADGVLIAGCRADNCQNGSGPEIAENNIKHTDEVLNLLGLKRDRLQFSYYLAHESGKFSSDLREFVERIEGLGQTPISGK